MVVDEGWFFDTELLVLAEKRGLRVKEIAVRWTDAVETPEVTRTYPVCREFAPCRIQYHKLEHSLSYWGKGT